MVSLGIATGFERQYGVLKRLGTTPLGRPALLAAKTAAIVVVELVQMAVLVPVALALGWHAHGNPVVAVLAVVVGTVAFAGLGLLMAGTLRAEVTAGRRQRPLPRAAPPRRHGHPAVEAPRRLTRIRARAAGRRALRRAARGAGALGAGPGTLVLVAWALAAPAAAALTFRWE